MRLDAWLIEYGLMKSANILNQQAARFEEYPTALQCSIGRFVT